MALGKNKPCCYFCDINLPGCILFSKLLIAPLVVTNWRSLSWKSRPRFKNCWTAPWKFSEWIYRRLRIISRTRSRATQESSDEIYRRFCFVNSSETFQPPLWFSRNPLRELNGQNIFTWTTLCLQRVKIEICRGLKRKLVLAKTRFVWTIRFSERLLAGSLVEIWQLIRRQQTTNRKYCFSTNQRKNQNLVFEHMIRQVNVSCPPSLRLNTGKEGMIAGYKDGEDWHR